MSIKNSINRKQLSQGRIYAKKCKKCNKTSVQIPKGETYKRKSQSDETWSQLTQSKMYYICIYMYIASNSSLEIDPRISSIGGTFPPPKACCQWGGHMLKFGESLGVASHYCGWWLSHPPSAYSREVGEIPQGFPWKRKLFVGDGQK